MPTYSYSARREDGNLVKGSLHAANEERAIGILRSHNMAPVSLSEEREKKSILNTTIGGISTKDLIVFSRQSAAMINAGVPILATIKVLERQMNKTVFQNILRDIAYDIEAGESFTDAMSKHPKAFSPFFLGIVRTGEVSGKLHESLNAIADQLEDDYEFKQKVQSTLAYPVFVLILVIIMMIIMFTAVLPQLVELFEDAEAQLPWATQVIISLASFMQSYWAGIVVLVIAFGGLFRYWVKTPEGQYTFATFVLRIPVLSKLFQKIYLTRLTATLHTLFSSDVPLLESLKLAKESVGNKVYQRIMDDTIKSVKGGAAISSVWQQEVYMPPILSAMIGVGEKSGDMAGSFEQAHQFFKRDVQHMLGTITILLEPILMVTLGIGVGIVIAAVILPIYNLVFVL